jgi:hypothetical protein
MVDLIPVGSLWVPSSYRSWWVDMISILVLGRENDLDAPTFKVFCIQALDSGKHVEKFTSFDRLDFLTLERIA